LEALWINLATILAVFDIRKGVGKDGVVDEPVPEFTSGLLRYVTIIELLHAITDCAISHPKPYKCVLVPKAWQMQDALRSTTVDTM
jgi:hypothetical protein